MQLVAASIPLALAQVAGAGWAWLVWIAIGTIFGRLANRLAVANRLQAFGNTALGVFGAVFGGLALTVSGVELPNPFWTFVTAALGALLVLRLVHRGGRGGGGFRGASGV